MMTRRTLFSLLSLMPIFAPTTPLPSHKARAIEVSDFIQHNFWDASAKRYRPAFPPDPKALPYEFMWANGIQFSALVGGLRFDKTYRPLLDAFFDGLEAHFDHAAAHPAYDAYNASKDHSDKYYDDNQWMVLTFVEAYERTHDKKFLERAALLQKFIYSGWDEKLGGGIYWREDHASKNTCSNGPAAAAALALARHMEKPLHLEWAKRIVAWTNKTLQAPDGTFYDNIAVTDGRIEKTKWTYNTALMLRANLGLYRATKEAAYLAEAKRLAEASVAAFVNKETGAFRDEANFSHLLIEAFLDLHKETKATYLLEHARRNADFVYTTVRDPNDGGYFTEWKRTPRHDERKTLMANAPIARIYWLLAAYES